MNNSLSANICDFPISIGGLSENIEYILNKIQKREGIWIVTLNLEMIYRSKSDRDYNLLLKEADFFIADGVPLIWASHLKKDTSNIKGRSNGTDLVERILRSHLDFKIGVIGGNSPKEIIRKFDEKKAKQAFAFDGIVDLSNHELVDRLIEQVVEKDIDILFLGLGVPKQDKLAHKIKEANKSTTIIGIGGAFDLLGGGKSRAPVWMQNYGLEWLHRLVTEPKRLWKRYLLNYPWALFYLLQDILSISNSEDK